MKKWHSLVSSALLLAGICISNVGLALTPGYYVRMNGEECTGTLVVLEHPGTLCVGDKCEKHTLKLVTVTDRSTDCSLNATFYDLKKNVAVTDKALLYYGNEYKSFNGTTNDNYKRLYEEEELLPLKLEELDKGKLKVTSTEPLGNCYNGTYTKVETFYQASKPLVAFALEQQNVLPPRVNRSYLINTDDSSLNYNITALENGAKVGSYWARVDMSKLMDVDNNWKTLFISDFTRKYEAEQEKNAKG